MGAGGGGVVVVVGGGAVVVVETGGTVVVGDSDVEVDDAGTDDCSMGRLALAPWDGEHPSDEHARHHEQRDQERYDQRAAAEASKEMTAIGQLGAGHLALPFLCSTEQSGKPTNRSPRSPASDSAARLTRGVPWLCVPFSRRVCHFVGITNSECQRRKRP